ncbi:hypothetical protein MMC24_007339 [Lignoscripta atroalba]|nr:hypothetical protein [Lignoscripta atroalba]
MYLPRNLISHLYLHLIRTHHAQSPPVLLIVALEPDALCACRILTALLKRDYIAHTIQPVSGYGDLARVGKAQVQPMRVQQGGSGGTVVCLGVGGLVDLGAVLGLEATDDNEDFFGGVEVWIIDARRPWNLGNVFGGKWLDGGIKETSGNARSKASGVENGRIQQTYRPGQGGIIVYDDGDIDEELATEREAYCSLEQMPTLEDNGDDSDGSDAESDVSSLINGDRSSKKRKSWSDRDEEGDDGENGGRPRQSRRSNSNESISSSPNRPARRGLLSTSNNVLNGTTSDISRSPSPSSPRSSPPIPKQPSARKLRRRLFKLRRKHESVLDAYYSLGASYSEPVSSILYSLAEELGREDNDLLWHAIVGVSSLELYGRSMTGVGISTALDSGGSAGWGGERGERIRQVLRDEVRRLNPPDPNDTRGEAARGESSGVIPTAARSPTDNSIRLSPEPRFLLIRHWSLYESMLHSPYLAARLHLWKDAGVKRLRKFLAKMGVSLVQCRQSYTHMDMDLKRDLRKKLLEYAPQYGLDGLVPPPAAGGRGREGWGFVRSWGWKACLSAIDVGVIVGAILEVGKSGVRSAENSGNWDRGRNDKKELVDEDGSQEGEEWVRRFWDAYDALDNVEGLKQALPTAQHLHRAILRTGSSIMEKEKESIRHLAAFRMAIVKEGPDVLLFTHPSTLTKLALWVGEALAEQEREKRGEIGKGGKATPFVMATLHEARGVYVVVGTGGGGGVVDYVARRERQEQKAARARAKELKLAEKERKRKEREDRRGDEDEDEDESEEDDDDDDDDDGDEDEGDISERGYGKNRFGNAFQEVIEETNARVRVDSFEHCVVEVKKDDITRFLESLSMKAVVG